MEKLKPIPKEVLKSWKHYTQRAGGYSELDMYTKVGLIDEIERRENRTGRGVGIPNDVIPSHDELISFIESLIREGRASGYTLRDYIMKYIENSTWSINVDSVRLNRLDIMVMGYVDSLEGSSYSIPFPIDYTSEHMSKIAPELQPVYSALMELYDNGITWRDLHYENIMIGEGDGEIKIVDVGAFSSQFSKRK